MLVLDGMQDTGYGSLGGESPYDYGKGEAFRRLEGEALTGTLATTPGGFEPDTQTCVLTLLGVPAAHIPDGRSYIEALALGIPVGGEDLILRCNFVRVSPEGRLEVPCCSAPEDIARALRAEVASQEGVSVYPVGSYKSLQLIQGGRGWLEGLKTAMPHQHQGEAFEALLPGGNALADRLAGFSRRMLEQYRPYTVLNWAQAVKGELPAFAGLHGGISGGMVSATDAPIGAAVAMGMRCPRIPTATGDTDTDLGAKLEAAFSLLQTVDFTMLHIGGPDEATHRQNPREKADFFTKLDTAVIAPLMERAPEGTRVMLTCDHEALCSTAGHTGEPVRFWLWEKGRPLSGELGLVEGVRAVEVLSADYR
jgi:2,3-bisphosphoglycerate-independent phosphoglycerate mutase